MRSSSFFLREYSSFRSRGLLSVDGLMVRLKTPGGCLISSVLPKGKESRL